MVTTRGAGTADDTGLLLGGTKGASLTLALAGALYGVVGGTDAGVVAVAELF